jgi:hypothetical protein
MGQPSARKALHDRQQRESMGDEAYEKMVAGSGNKAFVWFGLAFIAVLTLVFFSLSS